MANIFISHSTIDKALADYICNYAFSACDDLNSIGIPAELNYLGEMAFAYCTNLSMITIPDGKKDFQQRLLADVTTLPYITKVRRIPKI